MGSYHLSGKLFFGLLALAWAAVISNFSTDRFSINHTSTYIEPLLRWLLPRASAETIYILHVIIRKLCHLSEYAIFAGLVFGIWAAEEAHWRLRWLGYALAVAALLAMLDEYHQTFTQLRVGSARDSLIDIAGSATGLLLLWLVKREKFYYKNLMKT